MEPSKKRGPYKQYLAHGSSKAVPESTLRHWSSKRKRLEISSLNDVDSSTSSDDEADPEKLNDTYLPWSSPDDTIHGSYSDDVELPSTSWHRNTSESTSKTSYLHKTIHEILIYDSDEEYPECSIFTSSSEESDESNESEHSNGSNDSDQAEFVPNIQECISNDPLPPVEGSCQNQMKQSYPKNVMIRTLLILAIKIKKNLDNDVIKYMTGLIDALTHVPSQYSTFYHFKKIIDSYSFPFQIHHFCPSCGLYIGVETNPADNTDDDELFLHCSKCGINILLKRNKQSGNIFLYMPLTEQLIEFCSSHHEKLFYALNRIKKCSYAFEDIMDGRMYKRKILSEDLLSLNFSVDGTPLFKSSQTSITPVLCTINELHPNSRKHHIILVSIFLGKEKPTMNEYLKPFTEEAKILAQQGISYIYNGTEYHKKIKILVGVCDSVERPNLRCSKSFRGAYGCGLCKHPGEEVAKGNGYVIVFPIDEEGDAFDEGLRSHEETLNHAEKSEKGIKQRSVLCDIPDFDIIKNLDVDWMHCVALGVCRQFLKLWFDPQYREKPFYLGDKLQNIDAFVISIKPSLDISRTPRKISDRSHLKAHELVIWLLFYSLPGLKPYLPRQYLMHWSLLVEAISMLLKTCILEAEVYYSQQCIFKFVKNVELLYGLEHVSFNVHLLTHLPESVLNWGPLWTHSAFCYENFHQLLKKLVKSSNSADLQILQSLRSMFALNKLIEIYGQDLTYRQQKLLRELTHKKEYSNNSKLIGNFRMVGKYTSKNKLAQDQELALQRVNIQIDENSCVHYYKRVIINKEMIHSQSYRTVKKRNSYSVLLSNGEVFEIIIFVVVEIEKRLECFAFGNYLKRRRNTFFPEVQLQSLIFLENQTELQVLAAVNVTDIQEKVTIVKELMNKICIACVHPNKFEMLT